jgi:hypothetical protein
MLDTMTPNPSLRDDLIEGASALSMELFGTPNRTQAIYRLARMSGAPIFRLGGHYAARRSKLKQYIETLEAQASEREVA